MRAFLLVESFSIQLDDSEMAQPNDFKLPRYDDLVDAAHIHVAAFAMQMANGNITHAADWTKTSRRTIRKWVKRGGLYPWIGNIYTPLDIHEILRPPIFENAGVVEDGRKGRVTLKCETVHMVTGMEAGPAYLLRGDAIDRLWHGEWVTYHRARTYALRNGHEF